MFEVLHHILDLYTVMWCVIGGSLLLTAGVLVACLIDRYRKPRWRCYQDFRLDEMESKDR